jgi:hypothetical protein
MKYRMGHDPLICDAPIAFSSLIDAERQWFESTAGQEAIETPRDVAFCVHAIQGRELFDLPNALGDERVLDNREG